jgi:hypothetical protein
MYLSQSHAEHYPLGVACGDTYTERGADASPISAVFAVGKHAVSSKMTSRDDGAGETIGFLSDSPQAQRVNQANPANVGPKRTE